ncbi:MAG TPA: hypothetical protein ENG87_02380 [Candidatus Pacearchaeota archaeon]|nr:hypothetical protein BMS3Abin17_00776 [archaeon BMS3Abin17]HDK42202.1 hypothetical protein [Candidatus Pacearchaeota archaeon]HDZ61461.1 hypothetical protein [Candidatus Pacearchaeota archaeon]
MGGLLTHLGIALAGLLVGYLGFKKASYGWSFFAGHIIPDALKFGITGLKLWTISPGRIIGDSLFWKIEALSSNYNLWIILGIFVIALSFFLYHIHKIRKSEMKTINRSYIFFLAGVFIHLIVDIFVIEKSYWF